MDDGQTRCIDPHAPAAISKLYLRGYDICGVMTGHYNTELRGYLAPQAHQRTVDSITERNPGHLAGLAAAPRETSVDLAVSCLDRGVLHRNLARRRTSVSIQEHRLCKTPLQAAIIKRLLTKSTAGDGRWAESAWGMSANAFPIAIVARTAASHRVRARTKLCLQLLLG